jgi:hypothetical protein
MFGARVCVCLVDCWRLALATTCVCVWHYLLMGADWQPMATQRDSGFIAQGWGV